MLLIRSLADAISATFGAFNGTSRDLRAAGQLTGTETCCFARRVCNFVIPIAVSVPPDVVGVQRRTPTWG